MPVTYAVIDKAPLIDIFEVDKTIRLEMKASTLKRLFEQRQLCASDFHCLDYTSKEQVKELCLKNCIRCLS